MFRFNSGGTRNCLPITRSRQASVSYRNGRIMAAWLLFLDLPETCVVIVGVKARVGRAGCPATDNAPSPSIAGSGRLDGVFPVVTALGFGKLALVITENRPVLVVRERSTLFDQSIGRACLGRQFDQGNNGGSRTRIRIHGMPACLRGGWCHQTHSQQSVRQTCFVSRNGDSHRLQLRHQL